MSLTVALPSVRKLDPVLKPSFHATLFINSRFKMLLKYISTSLIVVLVFWCFVGVGVVVVVVVVHTALSSFTFAYSLPSYSLRLMYVWKEGFDQVSNNLTLKTKLSLKELCS